MEQDVKLLFELAYHPVMYANNRLNGGDFISVAIPIIDALRKQGYNETDLKKAARIMVMEFNNLLDPKMSGHQIEETVKMVYEPGPITRVLAKQIADNFVAGKK